MYNRDTSTCLGEPSRLWKYPPPQKKNPTGKTLRKETQKQSNEDWVCSVGTKCWMLLRNRKSDQIVLHAATFYCSPWLTQRLQNWREANTHTGFRGTRAIGGCAPCLPGRSSCQGTDQSRPTGQRMSSWGETVFLPKKATLIQLSAVLGQGFFEFFGKLPWKQVNQKAEYKYSK